MRTIEIEGTRGSTRALSDLVHQGKVRSVGSSAFPAEHIVEAQWISERRCRERLVSEQLQYSILVRRAERDVLPTCARHGVGVIVWSPLAGGYLAGRYRAGRDVPSDSRVARGFDLNLENPIQRALHDQRIDIVEQLAGVASNAGCTLAQLSLAFALEHPAVSSAIIGPRTVEQLDDLLAGANCRLDDAALDAIDAVVAPGTNVATIDPWQSVALHPRNRRGGATRPTVAPRP